VTLSTGPSLNFFGDHMFAWSGQEFLTVGGTTLLDFISPNRYYTVVTNVSFDYSGCSTGDVLSWSLQGNEEALHVSKFAIYMLASLLSLTQGSGPNSPIYTIQSHPIQG